MNRKITFLPASLIYLTFIVSNEDTNVFESYSNVIYDNYNLTTISQVNPVISEHITKDINDELNSLNDQIKNLFMDSANQIKELLINEFIKIVPDIVMFNKGYVGLVWETKNNDNIFIYSIPDGTLFFNKVGLNFSETRTIAANKNNFSDLIKEINLLV